MALTIIEVSRWKTHIKENIENDDMFRHTLRYFSIRRGWKHKVNMAWLCVHKHSLSSDWERPEWVLKCPIIFHVLLYICFIWRSLHFFVKSSTFIPIFCYRYFGTFVSHVVSVLKVHLFGIWLKIFLSFIHTIMKVRLTWRCAELFDYAAAVWCVCFKNRKWTFCKVTGFMD